MNRAEIPHATRETLKAQVLSLVVPDLNQYFRAKLGSPGRSFLDLVINYCIPKPEAAVKSKMLKELQVTTEVNEYMALSDRMVSALGISEEELYTHARENFLRHFGMRAVDIVKLSDTPPSFPSGTVYVVTDNWGFRGSDVLLEPGALQTLSKECFHGEDVLLIPMSKSILLALAAEKNINLDEIQRLTFYCANLDDAGSPEDTSYLSDTVYRFHAREQRVSTLYELGIER